MLPGLCLAWALVVSVGLHSVWSYESLPGEAAAAPAAWPAGTAIAPAAGRATLVMLVHPHCPCSRASVEQLNRIMARVPGLLTAHVLFLQPSGVPEGWEKTNLWESIARVPGVLARVDRDGREAQRFGASTSGQVVLYDAGGRLLFSGGITPSRGHDGDNAGADAVVALVNGTTPGVRESPVFGCSLVDPGAGTAARPCDAS